MNRNIVTCIVLTIITCGIYGIYWFIVLTDDIARLANDKNSVSGGVAFLLSLITCGIYGYFWAYQMGKKIYIYGKDKNQMISDNSFLYVILQIFGLGIVNYALMQNDLNNLLNNEK